MSRQCHGIQQSSFRIDCFRMLATKISERSLVIPARLRSPNSLSDDVLGLLLRAKGGVAVNYSWRKCLHYI